MTPDDTLHGYLATRDLSRAQRRRLMRRTIICAGCRVRLMARHAAAHFAKCEPAKVRAAAELLKDESFAAAVAELPDPNGRG